MTKVLNGGLVRPGVMPRILGPWVVLTIEPSHLEFRMRFRWLSRCFGPWRLERSVIRAVYPGRMHTLDPWGRVDFLAEEIMPWAFLTQWPFDVLDAAKELGYPVQYDDRIP